MSEQKIEPALSADEWHEYEIRNADGSTLGVGRVPGTIAVVVKELSPDGEDVFSAAGSIALANDALRPDDPRKITREMIGILRQSADRLGDLEGLGDNLELIADALESDLPPETREPVFVKQNTLGVGPGRPGVRSTIEGFSGSEMRGAMTFDWSKDEPMPAQVVDLQDKALSGGWFEATLTGEEARLYRVLGMSQSIGAPDQRHHVSFDMESKPLPPETGP